MKDEFKISGIIPTKDRVDEICRCMHSILKQTLLPHEIIIVDSSKGTYLHSVLKRNFPSSVSKIKYIHSEVSNNAARNIGVRHCSGDIVFFFDDDVVLDSDYIKEVVDVFLNDDDCKIGGVMGNIVNTKRDINSLGNKLLRLFFLAHFGNGRYLPSGFPTWIHGEKEVMKTEFLPLTSPAYRRAVFSEFVFDEKLGKLSGYCYLDDVDFCYRVSRRYTLMYTPSAKLEHHLSKTTRVGIAMKKRQWVLNYFYLFKKNMPKRFTNVFAFCFSIFGLIIMTWLEKDLKAIIGLFQGIKDMTKVSRLYEDVKHR